jgi:transcriptional regulator with XRE-family HTH domain
MKTKSLGARFRVARQTKNLTIEYVAFELGMSPSGYGKIERGEVMPRLPKLEKLCALLEVDPHGLLGGQETKQNILTDELARELATLNQEVATLRAYLQIALKEISSLRQELTK